MRKYSTVFFLCCCLQYAVAQYKHGSSSLYSSYHGLVMAGYQGWFNAMGDGAGRGWNHYVAHGDFKPGNAKIDLWPDVSEYKKTYPTPFLLGDSSPALLYSPYDASSVDLHFKWMKQYGIDGVFMQRFVADIKGAAALHHNNTVLTNALASATRYGRAIAVMYDLSGMRDSDYAVVTRDWKWLVDSLRITNRGKKQTYLFHRGKPLVTIWGVGFADGRRYGLATVERLVDFFKNDPVYGGCSVMLGVPTYWRDLNHDTETEPHLHTVLRKADIIQPWFVGRFNEETYPSFCPRIKDDIAWCAANQLDYVPVIFPGFSWHNMNPKSPQDQIPRNRGRFFWQQIAGAASSGAKMIYVAMFDEVDEGTAIFKINQNPPIGLSHFVKFEEGIPPDYYLYLAGLAARMLRGEIPVSTAVPLPASPQ